MPSRLESEQTVSDARSGPRRIDLRALLRILAQPRLSGSKGAENVTAEIRNRFEELGYEVRDYPFRFSTWPGRWAIAIIGVTYTIGAFTATGLLIARHPGVALALLCCVLLLAAAIGVLARPAIAALPWGRVETFNQVAVRPGTRPRFLMMAHRDSKSQPLPLAFRGPAIVLAVLTFVLLFVFSGLAVLDVFALRTSVSSIIGSIAVVSAVMLVFSWVDNRSPGALDNASGVATLIGVAEREATSGDVGFIITDGEEFGLAGSRAIAPGLPPSHGLINLDGIDDDGTYYVIERFGWPKKTGAAPHLAAAIMSSAAELNEPATRHDVPVGLLLDHIPVVQAGTPAVTLMRGSLSSLRRVHQPTDSMEAMTGSGVERTVDLLSGALKNLRAQSAPHLEQ